MTWAAQPETETNPKPRAHYLREGRPLCDSFRFYSTTPFVPADRDIRRCKWCRRAIEGADAFEAEKTEKNFVNALREFLGLAPLYKTKEMSHRDDIVHLHQSRADSELRRFYRIYPERVE